jgi:uncharacterized protein
LRVGITGASGLIGAALIDAISERGDSVVTFARPTSPQTTENVVRWDPKRGLIDEGDLRRVGGFDVVVNLSGAGIGDKRWSPTRKSEILRSRIDPTSLLVQTIGESKGDLRLFASASAVGWYGSRDGALLDESSGRGEGFLADVCDAWENAALALTAFGVAVTCLRTGIVLSAKGGALKKQLPLYRFGLGGPLGTGNQWVSPISLFDEVAAILWVIDHGIDGPVNMVSPTPLTNRSFTRDLAKTLHRPNVFAVPAVALRVALGREMANELILASQRVVPQRLLSSGFAFCHPDASSALAWALGA